MNKIITSITITVLSLSLSSCEKNNDTPSVNSTIVPTSTVKPEEIKAKKMSVEIISANPLAALQTPKGQAVSRSDHGAVINSSVKDISSAGTTQGVFKRVPDAFESAASGKLITVRVTAKAEPANPSSEFAVAYSTNANGNSGWNNFSPSEEFQEFSFTYLAPVIPGEGKTPISGDFVGINSDTTGSGAGVVISSIVLEVEQ